MDKKLKKDKNSFLIVWISCIVLLLTMCYFGVNSSLKGTSAANSSCYCPMFAKVNSGGVDGKQYCSITKTQSISGWNCASATNANGTTFYECSSYDACVSLDELSCSYVGWSVKKGSGDSTTTACCPEGYKYYDTVHHLHEYNPDTKKVDEIEYKNGVCVKNPIKYVADITDEWSYFETTLGADYCVIKSETIGTKDECPSGTDMGSYCQTSVMSLCTIRPSEPSVVNLTPTSEACFYDATKSQYVWGNYSTGATIHKVDISVKSECLAKNNPKKCFICSSGNSTYNGNIYAWTSSTSGLECSTSWSDASTIEENECKEKTAGKFIATFDGNSGNPGKDEESCIYKVGTGSCNITMPGATRSGYTFDGWTKTKDSCSSPIKKDSTQTITSDVKYYACWTEKSSDNGNNNGTPTNETYTGTFMNDSTQFATTTCTTSGGNSCTLPAPTTNPTKDGYTFKGWGSSGCTDGWIGNKSGVSSNQTYYACWLSNTSAGASKPSSGGNVSTNPGTGPIAIAITWFVGIFAIAYSVFYFKKIKES